LDLIVQRPNQEGKYSMLHNNAAITTKIKIAKYAKIKDNLRG
jgi:hypothetical protein